MKKIIAIILAAIFTLSMTACSKQEEQSDLDYVMNKGVLVVGVTEFEPMDYLDENGEWIGFDAELAKAFAESEFEQYRVIQDQLYQSDFDRLVASTEEKD